VYRVVARDARAGEAGLASSDPFYIEVAGPGQVALEGFEMPPDRERYALSQQMIVLKIQRLREREAALAREAFHEQAGTIAAEQRAVRAHFVFLMGGHVEDEEEEAEQSHEIQEGRLENTARADISRAITHMSRAEQGLSGFDTRAALNEAKLAVEALQRAFGQNRYILRALPVRSRIDPSRRLTGNLDDARPWRRALSGPPRDPRVQEIRNLLTDLIALVDRLPVVGKEASVLASAKLPERALAIAPSDPEWLQISTKLAALRDAVESSEAADTINHRFRDALGPIVVQARRSATPSGIDPGVTDSLRGAWSDELLRFGGAPDRPPRSRER
jgi:hypothetical protein